MITAKELRIGVSKLYYLSSEGDELICDIDHHGIEWVETDPKGFNLVHSPIPITEEILLKCGFENYQTDKYNVFRLNGFLITYVNEGKFKGKKYLKFHNFTFEDFGHIKHLHTFQNLYFALTGQELEINF